MPTKRIMRLFILSGLALNLSFALPKMAAKRWTAESNGWMGVLGDGILQATS